MTSCHFGKLAISGVLCIGALFASLSAAPPATQPSDTDRTAAQIAQERFEVLTKEYELTARRHHLGYATSELVIECLRRRAAAARDLPDAEKRNAVLRDCVKKLKEQIVQATQRFSQGAASEEDILRARDNELEAELWLAKSLGR